MIEGGNINGGGCPLEESQHKNIQAIMNDLNLLVDHLIHLCLGVYSKVLHPWLHTLQKYGQLCL